MSLCAADLGLQSSWITGFRETSVRTILGIPQDIPVVTLLAVGYPDGFVRLPDRRPVHETVSWDAWEEHG